MNIKRTMRVGFILLFAGFAIGIPGVWLLIAPSRFEATARIEIIRQRPDGPPDTGASTTSIDPYFIQIEFEIMGSSNNVSEVVEKLHLDVEWGKRYQNGARLAMADAIYLLKQNLHLTAVSNSMMIEVAVISEDAKEAADIANAIAEAYRDRRMADYHHLQAGEIAMLKEQSEEQKQKIATQQEEITRLKNELNPPNNAQENSDPKFQPYWDAVDKLHRMQHFLTALETKVQSISEGEKIPTLPQVLIIQPAIVPTYPINSYGRAGRILLLSGIFVMLVGVRFLWRGYFAYPGEA